MILNLDANSSKFNDPSISNDNHAQPITSLSKSTESADLSDATSRESVLLSPTTEASESLKAPPRRKKKKPQQENTAIVDTPEVVKMRDKSESTQASRDSKPPRGTVMLKVNDLIAKAEGSKPSMRASHRPVPKPREKPSFSPESSVVASPLTGNEEMVAVAPSEKTPKNKALKLSPVPKSRHSLMIVKQPPLSVQTTESQTFPTGTGNQRNDFSPVTEGSSKDNAEDVSYKDDANHYGEIWKDRSPPSSEQEPTLYPNHALVDIQHPSTDAHNQHADNHEQAMPVASTQNNSPCSHEQPLDSDELSRHQFTDCLEHRSKSNSCEQISDVVNLLTIKDKDDTSGLNRAASAPASSKSSKIKPQRPPPPKITPSKDKVRLGLGRPPPVPKCKPEDDPAQHDLQPDIYSNIDENFYHVPEQLSSSANESELALEVSGHLAGKLPFACSLSHAFRSSSLCLSL